MPTSRRRRGYILINDDVDPPLYHISLLWTQDVNVSPDAARATVFYDRERAWEIWKHYYSKVEPGWRIAPVYVQPD